MKIHKAFVYTGIPASLLLSTAVWSYWNVVFKVRTKEKVIALTFDDGPHPEATNRLLDDLSRKGIKATFFLCGKHANAFPETVLRIYREGHEIGNHSMFHRPMIGMKRKTLLHEVLTVNRIIEELTGKSPVCFRAPLLIQGPGLKRVLNRMNMRSVAASAFTDDWRKQNAPEMIADQILKQIRRGSIIVLHDGDAEVERPHKQAKREGTVEAARRITTSLLERGYRFVRVSELLEQQTTYL